MTFSKPFTLGGFDEVLPAGVYCVETEEELLDSISFTAYRRKLTLIHLRPRPGHPGVHRTLTIDPKELDAAIRRDQALDKFLAIHSDRQTVAQQEGNFNE